MEYSVLARHERDILILTIETRKLEKILKNKRAEIERLKTYNRQILGREQQ